MANACNYPPKRLFERFEHLTKQIPRVIEQVAHTATQDGLDTAFLDSLVAHLIQRSKS